MIFSRRVHLIVFSKFEEVIEVIRLGVQPRFTRLDFTHSTQFNHDMARLKQGIPTVLVVDCRDSAACAASLVAKLRTEPKTRYLPVIYLVETLADSLQATLRDDLTDFCLLPADMDELATRLVIALRHRDAYRRLERQNQTLAYLASYDDLTGLYNRRFVFNILTAEARSTTRTGGIGVYLIDLDNFKQVNDNCGHQAGDQVLKNFSKMLNTCLRTNDVIGRIGGDEFCIVKLDTDLESCLALAHRLLECVRTTRFHDHDLSCAAPVTATVGVSYAPPASTATAGLLLELADKALYKAKDAGRDGFVLLQLEPDLAKTS